MKENAFKSLEEPADVLNKFIACVFISHISIPGHKASNEWRRWYHQYYYESKT